MQKLLFVIHRFNDQFDPAIVEKNHRSSGHFLDELGIGDWANRPIRRNVTARQNKRFILLEKDRAIFKFAEANFRALQILKNGNGLVKFKGQLADQDNPAAMFFVGAVGEIEPQSRCTSLDKPT